MASTYSPLKVELITTGEQSGTWGTTTNTNLGTALEEAIVGLATANFTSDANLTLTLTDSNATQIARHFVLNVTSGVSLTVTRDLIVPAIEKPYLIKNATTGSQSIIVKNSTGTGVTVPNGAEVFVYNDGTNVVSAIDHIPALTLGAALPVGSGGTGQTTYTNGQLLIGNTTGNTLAKATLTAGTGISVTNGAGSISIAATNNGTVTSVATGTGLTGGPITGTGTVSVATNGITDTLLRQSAGLSVIGRSTNTTGNVADVAAASDHQVLRRSGTAVGFGSVALNQAAAVTGTLPVGNGGTGATTLTANNVILGNGTSAVGFVAPGTTGNLLTSNGTTWTSAAAPAGGGKLLVDVFAASGTWTAPAGVTRVKVTVVAGGAGNARTSCDSASGGAGGVSQGVYTVTPATGYTVTVGAGSAGADGGSSSTAGTTSFGSTLISATGGTGANPFTPTNGTRGTSSLGNIFNSIARPANFSGETRLFNLVFPWGEQDRTGSGGTPTAAVAWSTSSYWAPGAPGAGALRTGGVGGAVFVEYIAP